MLDTVATSAEALFLRSILESPRGIIIFSLDRQYCYTVFTKTHAQTMREIWGVEIAVGMSMLAAILSDDDREKAKRNFDRALAGDYVVETEVYGDEVLRRTYWENRYSPLYDERGEIAGLTVFVTDKTEQMQAETRLCHLSALEDVLRERELLLNSMGEGVYGVNAEGICFFVNPAALSMLGYGEAEFLGKDVHRLIYSQPMDSSAGRGRDCGLGGVCRSLQRCDETRWFVRRDGQRFPVRMIVTPIVRDGDYAGAVIAFHDITQQYLSEQGLKASNELLRRQAQTDALTQCYNRYFLEDDGNRLWQDCARAQSLFSVIALDIDFFKRINDGYGHEVGDRMLVMVAQVIKARVRGHDHVVRMGGEEFLVLLPQTSFEKAMEIAQRIREGILTQAIDHRGALLGCTVSLGVASVLPVEHGGAGLVGLLRQADANLYHAKDSGRNQVVG